jgi:hypothetical protein
MTAFSDLRYEIRQAAQTRANRRLLLITSIPAILMGFAIGLGTGQHGKAAIEVERDVYQRQLSAMGFDCSFQNESQEVCTPWTARSLQPIPTKDIPQFEEH